MWRYNYTTPCELYHYGVKGMKWGIRRTPEQLGHKRVAKKLKSDKIKDTTVENAINFGIVSKKINEQKQLRHTKSNHLKGRSYLNGDLEYAQKLVDKLSSTGKAIYDSNGKWTNKENVSNDTIIGVHVDSITGKETRTNNATILYSKTGTHIYPRRN